MMDNNKRVVDLTLGEITEAIWETLKEKQQKEDGLTTDELARKLGVCVATVGRYGRAGMYEAPGCRIKKNRYDYEACRKWVAENYQEILNSGRKRSMLKTNLKSL